MFKALELMELISNDKINRIREHLEDRYKLEGYYKYSRQDAKSWIPNHIQEM